MTDLADRRRRAVLPANTGGASYSVIAARDRQATQDAPGDNGTLTGRG